MKIYISSTYEDLVPFRQAAYNQLRKMRHDVIAMEDYVAVDDRPVDISLRDVEECDLYIGLFAWRYGFVPTVDNKDKRSITEMEYRRAQSKPRLIFLLEEKAAWSPAFMDSQTGKGENGRRIKALRKELQHTHTIGWFSSPEQLAADVVVAVMRTANDMAPPPVAPPPGLLAAPTPAPAGPAGQATTNASAHARKDFPKLWEPGSTLRVRFLDGSKEQRRLVERLAPIWSAYANLQFDFGDDPDAELRVSFNEMGSWGFVGTDALNVPRTSPNLNFGWVTAEMPIAEAERVILHEFGHIVGFLHEHQNPAGKIPWNKPEVYRMYSGPPNLWSADQVDQTMFQTWDPALFPQPKPFDRQSIMMYGMPSELTLGKKIYFGNHTSLSDGDKSFAALLYPY